MKAEFMPTAIVRTLDLHNGNYGGILQAYALATVLGRQGVAAIVDVGNSDLPRSTLIVRAKVVARRFAVSTGLAAVLRPAWVARHARTTVNAALDRFVDQRMRTCALYTPEHGLDAWQIGAADFFVSGSDQILRRDYGDVESYLFDFLPASDRRPKIVYAGSFGSSEPAGYDRHFVAHTRVLAQRLDAISVREESGRELASRYWGVDAPRLVDPTMLLAADDYVELAGGRGEGGLVRYVLDENSSLMTAAHELDGVFKRSVKLTRPEPRSLRALRVEPTRYQRPSVEEWLREIAGADGVLTDSFHGCVFAILFHRNFLVAPNNGRGATRFETLLSVFGLEDRVLRPGDDLLKQLQKPIDWERVDAALHAERLKSRRFIDDALALLSSVTSHVSRPTGQQSDNPTFRSSTSAIIPTHDRPAELHRSIRSVLAQSVLPAEVIVVDDSLNESARAVVASYAEATTPVRYHSFPPVEPERGAPGRSRNKGVDLARGEFVAFLDDDDEWAESYLEQVLRSLQNMPKDTMVVTASQIRVGGRTEPNIMSDFSAVLPRTNHFWGKGVTGSNMAMPTELFRAHRGFDGSLTYAEDWELFARAVAAGASVSFVDQILVTQHVDGSGHLSSKSLRTETALKTYLARHSPRLNRQQERDIRRLIHVHGRRSENGPLTRARHLLHQFRLSTWYQRRSMLRRASKGRRLYG